MFLFIFLLKINAICVLFGEQLLSFRGGSWGRRCFERSTGSKNKKKVICLNILKIILYSITSLPIFFFLNKTGFCVVSRLILNFNLTTNKKVKKKSCREGFAHA